MVAGDTGTKRQEGSRSITASPGVAGARETQLSDRAQPRSPGDLQPWGQGCAERDGGTKGSRGCSFLAAALWMPSGCREAPSFLSSAGLAVTAGKNSLVW